MNRVFRLVWNRSCGRLVVASEAAHARSKSSTSGHLIGSALLLGGALSLLPGAMEEVWANTLDDGSQSCSSTGGTGTVGRQQYGQTNRDPEDGSGTFSTVAGCNAQGNDHLAATVYGTFSQGLGEGSAVFGFSSYAGQWATAIGLQNGAGGTASTALGFGTQAAGLNSVAIGGAGGNGTTPLALEDSTRAIGAHSIAIGANNTKGAQTTASNAIAIGGQAATSGESAVSLGRASSASTAGGVALGALSASTISGGIRGYDPSTGVAAADGSAIADTEGTTGAVSVGDPDNGVLRQITGVAAGARDTDAVNVAQLKAVQQVAAGTWSISAEGANSSDVASGETVDLANTDGNIEVSKTADSDNVTFDLADDLNANSLTLGDETQSTTLNDSGLTIANGPSVTTDGIDAAGDVISNVGDGVADSDAVNVGQLNAVNETANAGWNLTAQGENASNVAPGDTVDLANTDGNIEVSKSADSDNVTFDLANDLNATSLTLGDETQSTTLDGNGLTMAYVTSVSTDGIDAAGDVISNVGDGVADS
uniref:ESPR-type extended signal peptide-containing protein n=1 Tax=Halomonas sp. TaxID=1486246 RepID=UPI0026060317